MNQTRLVRIPELCRMLGICKSTVYNYAKTDPDFPKPRRITARAVGFDYNEVVAYVESRPVADAGGNYSSVTGSSRSGRELR
jgi:predicted DNA-binding transcriptional regulator AlpA